MALPATRVAQPAADRQPSPNGLTLNLKSNNPFRARATSPSPQSANAPSPPLLTTNITTTTNNNNNNRMSRNPFLSPDEAASATSPVKENKGVSGELTTEDIFKDLSLLDKPASNGAPIAKNGPPPPRTGNLPLPPPGHRPGGPSEQRDRPPRPPRGPDSPSKREPPKSMRPRGMSESSAMDEKERRDRRERERLDRPERTESEERRRRERRREREERHKKEKEKIRKGERSTMKRPQGLDIIDKLDVTGIYGQGLFHHDGPFDACNPHRNARTARRPAPMQAFPADSANMALGGNGPLRSKIDLDKFHGRGEEGFADYAVTRKPDTQILNPTDRTEPVHGVETHGLGTSTFLEGAPASRSALQRRESEDQQLQAEAGAGGAMGGGLTRKKSLAQRFRGMSNSRRAGPNGELRSPDARYAPAVESSPPQIGKAATAGGPARAIYTKENEVNPFENEYDSAFDKKGAEIMIAEQSAAPSSPKMGLTRSMTADSAAIRGSSNEEERPSGNSGGGFLIRWRSLTGGGRWARPERRDT